MPGINRAKLVRKSMFESSSSAASRPCIFLSHISVDKKTAIEIGNYIIGKTDVDIYLDIYDDELQSAVNSGDNEAITKYLENGLNSCTHIMCLVSQETVKSWWVPYEIGYAKKGQKTISTLTLKGTETLPSYLKIGKIIRGTKTLNSYLESIAKQIRKSLLLESASESLISHTASPHPLDQYLDWNS